MTVAAFVLGLLFIMNTTALALIPAECLCKANPYKLIAIACVIAVVNIIVNALLFVALY